MITNLSIDTNAYRHISSNDSYQIESNTSNKIICNHSNSSILSNATSSHTTIIQNKYRYANWKGLNVFLCNGSIMFGSHVYHLAISFTLLLLTWIFYIFLIIPFLHQYELYYLSIFLMTWNLLFLTWTATSDPGILPRNTTELLPMKSSEMYVLRTQYCKICRIHRSTRARHCRYCDNCVDVFDHHCPWTGTCIGVRNYPLFFIFVLSVFISCLFVFLTTFKLFLGLLMGLKTNLIWLRFLVLLVMLPWSIVLLLMIGILLGFHIILIIKKQTTNEFFRTRNNVTAPPPSTTTHQQHHRDTAKSTTTTMVYRNSLYNYIPSNSSSSSGNDKSNRNKLQSNNSSRNNSNNSNNSSENLYRAITTTNHNHYNITNKSNTPKKENSISIISKNVDSLSTSESKGDELGEKAFNSISSINIEIERDMRDNIHQSHTSIISDGDQDYTQEEYNQNKKNSNNSDNNNDDDDLLKYSMCLSTCKPCCYPIIPVILATVFYCYNISLSDANKHQPKYNCTSTQNINSDCQPNHNKNSIHLTADSQSSSIKTVTSGDIIVSDNDETISLSSYYCVPPTKLLPLWRREDECDMEQEELRSEELLQALHQQVEALVQWHNEDYTI